MVISHGKLLVITRGYLKHSDTFWTDPSQLHLLQQLLIVGSAELMPEDGQRSSIRHRMVHVDQEEVNAWLRIHLGGGGYAKWMDGENPQYSKNS